MWYNNSFLFEKGFFTWLLEDLLLHESGVVSLHDLLDLHLEGGHLAVQRAVVVQAAGSTVDRQNTFLKIE
jgi:hypothetical protein